MEALRSTPLLLCFAVLVAASDPSGECVSLKDRVQEDLLRALGSEGGFVAQKGSVDLSLIGIDSGFDCTKTNCYFSNPNSAYSFGLLPLAPEEDLETKLSGVYDLPEWGTTGLNGEEGFEYGLSPYWQLRGDEVVMAFGCTPPGESTRYFSVAPYIRGIYSEFSGEWVEISGSMQDGKGIVREADTSFGYGIRLKTSADQPEALTLKDTQHESVKSAFGKMTVVLFGASVSSTDNARQVAIDVLKKHGLADAVNILQIPREFGEVGLAEANYSRYSYYSLIFRYILDGTGISAFNKYAGQSPMNVWRLTPKTVDSNAISDRFGASFVIPRTPMGESSDNELFLADALDMLIAKVEGKYKETHAVAHTIGGQSIFDSLGIDYGKQCLEKETNICYFESRDAAYVSVFPSILLDIDTKFTYIVGVNHRVAGTTMYNNIALNSVGQEFGVASLDDIEIYGSAEQFLRGTDFEHLHQYLYAVQFSRSCDGRAYCSVIKKEGGRSVPEDKPVLLLERLYIKPQTGVGPDVADVLYPHAMTFTPWSDSKQADIVERFSFDIRKNSPCVRSAVGLFSCRNGITSVCCNAMAKFDSGNCFCSRVGRTAESVVGRSLDNLRILSVLCGRPASSC